MSAKLGIFWDIESCLFPVSKLAESVVIHLRSHIADRRPECGFAKEFFAVCDNRIVDKRLLDGLTKNGVVVVHVSSTVKNAKLQELIDMYVDQYGDVWPTVVCLITCDTFFTQTIRRVRRNGVKVILIHGRNCSDDLKIHVDDSYLFEDIIKNADDFKEVKTASFQISKLPNDNLLAAKMVNRMSYIWQNCCGKPEISFTDGKANIQIKYNNIGQQEEDIDVFGHKLEVKLFDCELKDIPQKTSITQLKNMMNSEQNLTKVTAKSISDLSQTSSLPNTSDEYRSVIVGHSLPKGVKPKKFVEDLMMSWNDNILKPELIHSVTTGGPNPKCPLHVFAISPEANKTLVFRSKKYLKNSGIHWVLKKSRAVAVEQNSVTSSSRRDRRLNGIDAVSVRSIDSKRDDSGPNLNDISFMTTPKTITQEFAQNLLKNKIKKVSHLKVLSVIIGLETKKDDNVAKVVRKLIRTLNDRRLNGNLVKTAERFPDFPNIDGKIPILVTAVSPQACKSLIACAEKYLKPNSGILWTELRTGQLTATDNESVCSEVSAKSQLRTSSLSSKNSLNEKKVKAIPQTNAIIEGNGSQQNETKLSSAETLDNYILNFLRCKSVIRGMNTRKNEDVIKIVRKLVHSWNDNKLNGNLIKTVERVPQFTDIDGKVPLVVTANNPEGCESLIAGAEKYLKAKSGILWTHLESDKLTATDNESICSQVSAVSQMKNSSLNSKNSLIEKKVKSNPQPNCVINGNKATNVKTTKNSDRKSVIKGLCCEQYEDPTRVVRRLVSSWRNSGVNGNMIEFVDRFIDTDGRVALLVTATHSMASQALRAASEFYLNPKNGILWTHYKSASPEESHKDSNNQSVASLSPDSISVSNKAEPEVTQNSSVETIQCSAITESVTIPDANPEPVIKSSDDRNNNTIESVVNHFKSYNTNHSSDTLCQYLDAVSSLSSLFPIYCPSVPFTHVFTEALSEGFVLQMRGRPNAYFDCFDINFIANDTDMAFHLNVCLPYSMVCRNSMLEGKWGTEEMSVSNLPFTLGHTFEIVIRVKQLGYALEVNGNYFCDYYHKIAVSEVKKLTITGAVTIEWLLLNQEL